MISKNAEEYRAFYDPAIERMSRDELEALQLKRLLWQLKRCYEGSAFYRERFKKSGLEPGDIRGLEDFRGVHFLRKEELRQEQQAYPPFGRFAVAPRQNWAELHPSTGTTGAPVNTIWSYGDKELITETTCRTLWCFGTRPGDIVQNAFSYGLWVAGLAVHYAALKLGCFLIPISATLTDRQIDYMLNPGATILLSTPSYALHIAERARERGIDISHLRLRKGCFGGEPGAANPSTRAKIEAGLGIDAYDYYGIAEIGPTFGSECEEKDGLHWAEDHHIIEIVEPETGRPCGEGQTGILVITHLSREATPMIRYWTSDYAILRTNPCGCGRTHARSPGGILGRHDDLVIYRGAKFYPSQVEKVVRSFAELTDEFQIEMSRQKETGVDICTVVAEYGGEPCSKDNVATRLRKALKQELLASPEIRLVEPGTLERTTFKARRVVDKRS